MNCATRALEFESARWRQLQRFQLGPSKAVNRRPPVTARPKRHGHGLGRAARTSERVPFIADHGGEVDKVRTDHWKLEQAEKTVTPARSCMTYQSSLAPGFKVADRRPNHGDSWSM